MGSLGLGDETRVPRMDTQQGPTEQHWKACSMPCAEPQWDAKRNTEA